MARRLTEDRTSLPPDTHIETSNLRSDASYMGLLLDVAQQAGYEDYYLDKILFYARNLIEQKLPVIFDHHHLQILCGYRAEFLYAASNASERFYRTFEIVKRTGGYRTISEPLTDLKAVQTWILNNILSKIPISDAAKAFRRGHSIKSGARFHLRQPVVLRIDMRDFFPSLKTPFIHSVFRKIGYSKAVSGLLAGLVTFQGALPQGAPTSPTLSNILFRPIDETLLQKAKLEGGRYSRYADDLVFSGKLDVNEKLSTVRKLIEPLGLRINSTKTRVMHQWQRQIVTGIIVNQKLSVERTWRRRIRQEVYFITKYGLGAHVAFIKEVRANYLEHLLGKIEYCLFVNKNDSEMQDNRRAIIEYTRAGRVADD